jgi:hypothetical protein
MVGPTAQGSLMLGALSPQPAGPGRLAAAYLGRPVYDNYAVFEVPVTMAGDAALGSKHVAAVDMRFDLFDGNTAQPIGRFVDRVSMEIEVGRVADPDVRGLARGASAPPAEAPTTGAPAAAPVAAPDAGLDRLRQSRRRRSRPSPRSTRPVGCRSACWLAVRLRRSCSRSCCSVASRDSGNSRGVRHGTCSCRVRSRWMGVRPTRPARCIRRSGKVERAPKVPSWCSPNCSQP